MPPLPTGRHRSTSTLWNVTVAVLYVTEMVFPKKNQNRYKNAKKQMTTIIL